jgi:LysM repeat protein
LEKLKKAFIYLLLTSGSTWGLLAPSIASAGFFSFSSLLQGIIPQASAASEVQNSQTLALLAPATNLDPSPDTGSDVNVAGNSALVPQDGPSGTAADIDERPASYAITVYTVRDGDTLSGIAEMFNVPVGAITGANELQGKPIHPGQELIILPIATSQYTVKTGDTIESIAKATHSDAFDLKQYNDSGKRCRLNCGLDHTHPQRRGANFGTVALARPAKKSGRARQKNYQQGGC